MNTKENFSPNVQNFFELCRKGNVEKVIDWLQNRCRKLKSPLNFLRLTTPCSGWLAALREPSTLYTALHLASLHGYAEVVELLVQNDIELVLSRDCRGCLPLHLAAWNGHYDIVALLLNADAGTVNAVNNAKECPLHLAALHGHSSVIVLLLQRQADAQIRNARFETALDIAARTGKADICRLLVENCPALTLQSAAESTATSLYNYELSSKVVYPLHLAARYNNVDCVDVLCQCGFDVNCVTFEGTALHVAAIFGHSECVRILIDYGADLCIKDSESLTPLERLRECEEQKGSDMATHVLQSMHGWTECRKLIEDGLQNRPTAVRQRKSPSDETGHLNDGNVDAARGVVWRVIADVSPPTFQPPTSTGTATANCSGSSACSCSTTQLSVCFCESGNNSYSVNGNDRNIPGKKLSSDGGGVNVSSNSVVRRLFPRTSKKRFEVSLDGEVKNNTNQTFSPAARIPPNQFMQTQCKYQCPPFYSNVEDVLNSQFLGSNCLFYDNVPEVANLDSKWSHNCCPTKSEPMKAATIGVSNGHKYNCHGNYSRGTPVGQIGSGGCCCVSSVSNGFVEVAVNGGGIYTMPKKPSDRPSVFDTFGGSGGGSEANCSSDTSFSYQTTCPEDGSACTGNDCCCQFCDNAGFEHCNLDGSPIKIHECAPIAMPEETDVASTLSHCGGKRRLDPSSTSTSSLDVSESGVVQENSVTIDKLSSSFTKSSSCTSTLSHEPSLHGSGVSDTQSCPASPRSENFIKPKDDKLNGIVNVNGNLFCNRANGLTYAMDSSTCSSEKIASAIDVSSEIDHSVEWKKIDEILSAIQRDSFFQLNKECNNSSNVNDTDVKPFNTANGVAGMEALFVWLHMDVGFPRELAVQLAAALNDNGFDNISFMKSTLDRNRIEELGFDDVVQDRILNYLAANIKDCVRSISDFDYLSDWLDSLALIDYLGAFAKSNVAHSTKDIIVRGLRRDDLEKMGIIKVGHITRILLSLELHSHYRNRRSALFKVSPAKSTSKSSSSLSSTRTDVATDESNYTKKMATTKKTGSGDGGTSSQACGEIDNRNDVGFGGYNCLLSDSFSSIDASTRRQLLLDSCVVFSAHYLGSMEISNVEGAEDCRRAMNASKKRIKQVNKVPQVILEISIGGVNVLDASTNQLTVQHEINRIQVVCQDELDLNCFAYIFQDGEKNFCHVYCVLTAGVAKDIIITLGEAFNLAYSLINEKSMMENDG